MINCTKIKSSKNFENKVLKFFPKTNKDIFLDEVGMFRNKGLGGRYINSVTFVVDGEFLTFKEVHNDSQGWDEYQDWEAEDRKYQNWAKSTVLYFLSERVEYINKFFAEEIEI